jgi:LPXTG-motif cell wall-anchored protein
VDPDPLQVDPDPLPVDPTPTPVDPKPVDPNPLPVDPTPPVDPKPVDPTPPSVPASPTPVYAAPENPLPLQNDPVVLSAAVGGVSTQVGQLPARVVGGATETAAVSQVPAAQTLPAEQLAATGASDSNLALSGVGLGLVGAGGLMLCGRGRRAATA